MKIEIGEFFVSFGDIKNRFRGITTHKDQLLSASIYTLLIAAHIKLDTNVRSRALADKNIQNLLIHINVNIFLVKVYIIIVFQLGKYATKI